MVILSIPYRGHGIFASPTVAVAKSDLLPPLPFLAEFDGELRNNFLLLEIGFGGFDAARSALTDGDVFRFDVAARFTIGLVAGEM